MAPAPLLQLASEVSLQASGLAPRAWGPEEWDTHEAKLLAQIEVADSPYLLGEILRLDVGLDMPIEVVRRCYIRLFELGVNDVRTRLCFARYLLLHGPEWDREAEKILTDVEDAARAAGLWDGSHLGHHPVFFQGRAT